MKKDEKFTSLWYNRLNDKLLESELIYMVCDYNIKTEQCAMAVVICKGKILAIEEMIYGKSTISLPKGHIEENETSLETAIRECYEETNIVITESNVLKKLSPYSYEFLRPTNILIKKTLMPYLFEVDDFQNPLPKEEKMISVQWMDVDKFLSLCSYDTVKNTVAKALNMKL